MNPDPHLPRDEEALIEMLRSYFLRRAHPDRPKLLGLEFEFLRVREDGSAAPSQGEGGPEPLLESLVPCLGDVRSEKVVEGGVLSMIRVGRGSLSLEPGGQMEVSLPPKASPLDVVEQLDCCVTRLEKGLRGTPYHALYLGHQPLTMPEEIPLRAKPRYEIMDRRLRRRGRLGPHMMRTTAGMQVTLDVESPEDAFSMLLAATVAAPMITAFFANSPLVGGQDAGFRSFREEAWWHTDGGRCGVPMPLLEPGADFDAYIRYTLDAECWFLERGEGLTEVAGERSFLELWKEEPELRLSDFALHSTTLFPVARIRNGIEVRSADCVEPEVAPAFCALAAGLLYDPESREAAISLHPFRDAEEVRALHEEAARAGVGGSGPKGFDLASACDRLLGLAEAGLRRLEKKGALPAGNAVLLRPLRRRLEEGRSFADEALECFREGGITSLLERDRCKSHRTYLEGLPEPEGCRGEEGGIS